MTDTPQLISEQFWLNKKQAASYLNISFNTFAKYERNGIIRGHGISSRTVRFLKSELDEQMKKV